MLFINSRQGDFYIYSIVILILIRYIISLFSLCSLFVGRMIKLVVGSIRYQKLMKNISECLLKLKMMSSNIFFLSINRRHSVYCH